jgi:hypothetical protein
MTVDGEARSFVVETCGLSRGPGGIYKVGGRAKDDAGYTLAFSFRPNTSFIQVSKYEPEYTTISYYTPRDATAAVYRIEGATVTLDGTLENRKDRNSKHSIQMSFDCSG